MSFEVPKTDPIISYMNAICYGAQWFYEV